MRRVRFRDSAGYARVGELDGSVVSYFDSEYPLEDIDLLPPIEPSKILAVGRNYTGNVAEADMTPPEEARLFFKPSNTVIGPGDTVTLPAGKDNVVYEAELGVVIGEQCRAVSEDDAMSVVMGYTCVNDISNLGDRDIDPGAVRVKGFDGAAPIGPVVASPDRVSVDDASIELRVNGEVRQQSSTKNMILSIPELIREITRYVTLESGDLIATGTPAGISPLRDGDRVAIDIEGIGTLEHDVEQ